MIQPKDIQRRAGEKLRKLENARRDPRYRKTLGALAYRGLLTLKNTDIPRYRGKLRLHDALFAGEIEPRVLELLPALLLKTPAAFASFRELPPDQDAVLTSIGKGSASQPFRGIPPDRYLRWIPSIGHKDKEPSLLKTFRFQQGDLQVLRELKEALGASSEISVIRRALVSLRLALQKET